MARWPSDYASKHQDKVKGLILLGAYIYGNYPAENALTVYGTFKIEGPLIRFPKLVYNWQVVELE